MTSDRIAFVLIKIFNDEVFMNSENIKNVVSFNKTKETRNTERA